MIVFIVKLYARNNIFKHSVFILNFVHISQLTLLCLLLTLRTLGRTTAIKKIQERQIKTRFKLLNMIKAAK